MLWPWAALSQHAEQGNFYEGKKGIKAHKLGNWSKVTNAQLLCTPSFTSALSCERLKLQWGHLPHQCSCTAPAWAAKRNTVGHPTLFCCGSCSPWGKSKNLLLRSDFSQYRKQQRAVETYWQYLAFLKKQQLPQPPSLPPSSKWRSHLAELGWLSSFFGGFMRISLCQKHAEMYFLLIKKCWQ